jgi:hypothetical protein
MRLHDLRHFAGTMTAQVANLIETMERLGHSKPAASLRYQGQVSGRAVELPKRCRHKQSAGSTPAGPPCSLPTMVDTSVGGFGALVRG